MKRVPRYGRIACGLHGAAAFRALSKPKPNAQTLLERLHYSEDATSLPGLVRAGVATLAESLAWSQRSVERHLLELVEAGFVQVDRAYRLIWVPRQFEVTPLTSPKQAVAWVRTLREYVDSELFHVIKDAVEAHLLVDENAHSGSRTSLGDVWAREMGSALPSRLPKTSPRVLLTTNADPDTETDPADVVASTDHGRRPVSSGDTRGESLLVGSGDLHGWRTAALELLELWRTVGPPSGRIAFDALTPRSRRQLRDALALRGLDAWEATFRRVARSDYLAGRGDLPAISLWRCLELADRIDAGEFDTRTRPSAPVAPPLAQDRVFTAEDLATIREEQRLAAEEREARKARGEGSLVEQLRRAMDDASADGPPGSGKPAAARAS